MRRLAALVLAVPLIAACSTATPSVTGTIGPVESSPASSSPAVIPSVPASPEVSAAPVTPEPTAAPAKTPKPSPTANTNPRIVTWEVPELEDCTSSSAGSIHVTWEVARATGVSISIDGPGLYDSYEGKSGEIDLPFGCDATELEHTYTLRTTGGTGPAATRTKTVTARPPSIVSFTIGKPDCGPGDTFVGISMSFEVRAATGAELRRDGGVYSTYSTKATDDIVLYDCSKESQVWKLTTTGGYGDAATKSRTVNR